MGIPLQAAVCLGRIYGGHAEHENVQDWQVCFGSPGFVIDFLRAETQSDTTTWLHSLLWGLATDSWMSRAGRDFQRNGWSARCCFSISEPPRHSFDVDCLGWHCIRPFVTILKRWRDYNWVRASHVWNFAATDWFVHLLWTDYIHGIIWTVLETSVAEQNLTFSGPPWPEERSRATDGKTRGTGRKIPVLLSFVGIVLFSVLSASCTGRLWLRFEAEERPLVQEFHSCSDVVQGIYPLGLDVYTKAVSSCAEYIVFAGFLYSSA